MIKMCTCAHPGQDKLHGKNRRVYNESTKGSSCTVCGKEAGSSSIKKKGK